MKKKEINNKYIIIRIYKASDYVLNNVINENTYNLGKKLGIIENRKDFNNILKEIENEKKHPGAELFETIEKNILIGVSKSKFQRLSNKDNDNIINMKKEVNKND